MQSVRVTAFLPIHLFIFYHLLSSLLRAPLQFLPELPGSSSSEHIWLSYWSSLTSLCRWNWFEIVKVSALWVVFHGVCHVSQNGQIKHWLQRGPFMFFTAAVASPTHVEGGGKIYRIWKLTATKSYTMVLENKSETQCMHYLYLCYVCIYCIIMKWKTCW